VESQQLKLGSEQAGDLANDRKMTAEPLTDQDFENLSNVLQHFGGRRAMNIEQLDGPLAAIICSPSEIAQTEYLPEIWGGTMVNEDSFTVQPLLREFLSLVERHRFKNCCGKITLH
jgi:uncharacterized protein